VKRRACPAGASVALLALVLAAAGCPRTTTLSSADASAADATTGDGPQTRADGATDSATPRDAAAADSSAPLEASAPDSSATSDALAADADGGPTATCTDGSPVSYVRTMCPQAPIATPGALVASATGATRGGVLSLGGIAESAAPCAPVLVCTRTGAPTMLFSDDPESPASDGVLYADVIGPGSFRVYVYHTNGGSGLRKFPVVLLNQGGTDVHAVVGPKGVAGPGTDYVAIGKSAIAAWLGATTTQPLVVPAGQRVLFDTDLDLVHAASGELAHAIIDFTVDGPVKLSVVSVTDAEDAAIVTAGLSLLPDDQLHQRGTFPGADRILQATTPLDGASVRHLTLGDDVADPNLSGHDAVDGTTVSLGGNYGLVYELDLAVAVHTAFVIAPQGGAWGGGAAVPAGEDGPAGIVPLPAATSSLGSQSQAILLGRFLAPTAVSMTLVSAGGSNLPIDVASVPLP
jgi:hypothetical protein